MGLQIDRRRLGRETHAVGMVELHGAGEIDAIAAAIERSRSGADVDPFAIGEFDLGDEPREIDDVAIILALAGFRCRHRIGAAIGAAGILEFDVVDGQAAACGRRRGGRCGRIRLIGKDGRLVGDHDLVLDLRLARGFEKIGADGDRADE